MTPTKRAALRNSEGENTPLSSFKRRRQSLMDDYVGSVRDNPIESSMLVTYVHLPKNVYRGAHQL
jgi:hypothetical protein